MAYIKNKNKINLIKLIWVIVSRPELEQNYILSQVYLVVMCRPGINLRLEKKLTAIYLKKNCDWGFCTPDQVTVSNHWQHLEIAPQLEEVQFCTWGKFPGLIGQNIFGYSSRYSNSVISQALKYQYSWVAQCMNWYLTLVSCYAMVDYT